METQNYVEYELVDPVITERRLITESRDEAVAYYEKGWMVYEHYITVTVPSPYISTRQDVAVTWNNNPDFEV